MVAVPCVFPFRAPELHPFRPDGYSHDSVPLHPCVIYPLHWSILNPHDSCLYIQSYPHVKHHLFFAAGHPLGRFFHLAGPSLFNAYLVGDLNLSEKY